MRIIRNIQYLLVIPAVCLALGTRPNERPKLNFSYHLVEGCRTSAGIFSRDGSLVRTLWSNKTETAGAHESAWDGLDDYGRSRYSSDKEWTVKVLCSRVLYRWDGVIGNTEGAWATATNIWEGLGYKPAQLRFAFVGNSKIWASTGYSEGTANLLQITTSSPNRPKAPYSSYANQNVQFVDIDADDSDIYLANAAVWSGANFITKLDAKSASPRPFTRGKVLSFPQSWRGVDVSGIDITQKGVASPTAIAVQSKGELLAVAYASSNLIKFYSKDSGAEVADPLSVKNPTSMGFTAAGLWVLADRIVYLISDPGGRNDISHPLKGLDNPVYVTTNKLTGSIFVLDGGTSQQVKEFSSRYSLVRTFGDIGGYTDWNPMITSRRLMLDDTATTGKSTPNGSWLRVSPDNQLWICDAGNAGRILHISPSNQYIGRILFSQETYALGVSRTRPSRLFRGMIEYKVDYSKQLRPGDPDPKFGGNGSWEMVRNWAVGAEGANGSEPAAYDTFAPQSGILYVERLGNGRDYGHVRDPKSNLVREAEFPASGDAPIRFTGWSSPVEIPMQIDGSLIKTSIEVKEASKAILLEKSQLTGFSIKGDPVRHPFVPILRASYDPSREPTPTNGWGMSSLADPTSGGIYPIYATRPYGGDGGGPKFHLGGLSIEQKGYVFLTNAEGCIEAPDGHGTWPCRNSFGGHNGIGVQAIDRNIFATYDGQYAKYGQQVFHFWADGLMVGQFGQNSFGTAGRPRPPGSGGNIAMTRFVKVEPNIYLYMSVEAGYTPLQRWRISNLDSIVEFEASGSLPGEIKLRIQPADMHSTWPRTVKQVREDRTN